MDWVQGSVIVDADGYPLVDPAERGDEQILLATLNLAEARNKRISRHNHHHHYQDRRPVLLARKDYWFEMLFPSRYRRAFRRGPLWVDSRR